MFLLEISMPVFVQFSDPFFRWLKFCTGCWGRYPAYFGESLTREHRFPSQERVRLQELLLHTEDGAFLTERRMALSQLCLQVCPAHLTKCSQDVEAEKRSPACSVLREIAGKDLADHLHLNPRGKRFQATPPTVKAINVKALTWGTVWPQEI